ncbi:MAG: hypothetical protein ACKO7Z_09600 [Cyanobacteriota bacterium]
MSLEQLKALADALLDFTGPADPAGWLAGPIGCLPPPSHSDASL